MSKAALVAKLAKAKFWAAGHKPEITLVLGIATMAGCVVTTAIAAKKSSEVLNEARMDIEDIDADGLEEFFAYQNARREAEGLEPIPTENKDPETEKKKIKRKATIQVAKYWALPVALGGVSIFCQISTYRTLSTRLLAASAAAIAAEAGRRELESVFGKYRNVIADKIGVDEEQKAFEEILPTKTETLQGTDYNTGEAIDVDVQVPDEKKMPWYSQYSKYRKNESYQPGIDVMSVKNIQNVLNDRLSSRGYVLLNEAYEALGLPINGNYVGIGWISKEFNKGETKGDGFIDFGVFPNPETGKLLNGMHPRGDLKRWLEMDPQSTGVQLDFNVDGPIYKYINSINGLMAEEKDTWVADRAAFWRGRPRPYHVG